MTEDICPKCKEWELEEDSEDFDEMSDGQMSNYLAGFDHSFSCSGCGYHTSRDVDMFDVEDIDVPSEYYANAMTILNDIQVLVHESDSLKPDAGSQQLLLKLSYGAAVMALETYLGDAFKYNVLNWDENLHSFAEKYTPFKKDIKYTLSELWKDQSLSVKEFIALCAKRELNKIIFHKLPRVQAIYKKVLDVNFPEKWKDLMPIVSVRHDIFHRAGKDVEGKEHRFTADDVDKLVTIVSQFIDHIEDQLPDIKPAATK